MTNVSKKIDGAGRRRPATRALTDEGEASRVALEASEGKIDPAVAHDLGLTAAQARALAWFRDHARGRRDSARATIRHVLRMADVAESAFAAGVDVLRAHGRIVVHFHPDRLARDGEQVATALLRDGIYKSQFETGISSGSTSAHAGGARDAWERSLYGGAYAAGVCEDAERPTYGALDLLRHGDGPAPRFGSCQLVLRPHVLARCTFTWRDSHLEPAERGTLDELDDVLAALLLEVFERSDALGSGPLSVAGLVQRLHALAAELGTPRERPMRGTLDHYIEAQIHGRVQLHRDVERLVVDPSFEGTSTGRALEDLGARHGLPVLAHAGRELAAADVPRDFRGPTMPSLAARIADTRGMVDACAIGRAARSVVTSEGAWRDRGAVDDVLQELKLLWHCVVRFGGPREARRSERGDDGGAHDREREGEGR